MTVRKQATGGRKTGKVIGRGKWVELRDTSPIWQMVFSLYGKRISKTSRTANKREAEKRAAALRQELDDKHLSIHGKRGVPTRQRDSRLLDAVDWFWEHKAKNDRGANDTWLRLKRLVDILGKDTLLSDITDERVIEAIAALERYHVRNDPKKGTISDDRVDAHIKTLRRLMLDAVDVRKFYLPDMPDWPRHTLTDQPRTREATIEEIDAITAGWRMDTRAALLFLFESGVRLANAIELKWSQVNWETRRITLKVKSPKPSKKRQRRDLKARRKTREIVITPAIEAILRSQEGKHPEAVFTYANQTTKRYGRAKELRFRGQYYPLTTKAFVSYWQKIRVDCGIVGLRLHDLRRTRGSWLYRATGDIKLVKEFLHHENMRTTESTYAHVAPEQLVAGLARTAIYEADMRKRLAERIAGLQPDGVEVTEIAAEIANGKGVTHCRTTHSSSTSNIRPSSATSLSEARDLMHRLELNPRFQTILSGHWAPGQTSSGEDGNPINAANRRLQPANCRKITGVIPAHTVRTLTPENVLQESRFARSCAPYMDDPGFLISFAEALYRCFETDV